MPLRNRLIFTILVVTIFLAVITVQAWMSDNSAQQLAQEQLTEELKEQVSLLLEQRNKIEAEYEQRLTVIQGWLDKAAVPRETILQNARQDAAEWCKFDLNQCYAQAILKKEGWNVRCRFDVPSPIPTPVIDYLFDPLTGKILSRQADDEDLP